MRILFDQGTPAPLRHVFASHDVATVYEVGWAKLSNGDLLLQAESQYELFITTDQNLRYQQNLTGRRLAILVLPTTSWPVLRPHAQQIASAGLAMKSGEFREFDLPE
jgi:hypothetical protein